MRPRMGNFWLDLTGKGRTGKGSRIQLEGGRKRRLIGRERETGKGEPIGVIDPADQTGKGENGEGADRLGERERTALPLDGEVGNGGGSRASKEIWVHGPGGVFRGTIWELSWRSFCILILHYEFPLGVRPNYLFLFINIYFDYNK